VRIELIAILAAVIVLLGVMGFSAATLLATRSGRWLLLLGLALVPLALTGTGVTVGIHESSRTSFCMGCHEMEPFAKSLFVDNPMALSAMHYQKRAIDRDSTCFSCHTDYAMFGDEKAKLNGLRHVWVHYFTTPPEHITLYQPYPNHNCLHCHDDARNFLEKKPHIDNRVALHDGSMSCLTCHSVVHDLDGVDAGHFWVAP
jgi:cytochrome c-type protein NapC